MGMIESSMINFFNCWFENQSEADKSDLRTHTKKCSIKIWGCRCGDGVFRAYICLSTHEHMVRVFLNSASMKPKDLDECLFLILKDWKNQAAKYEMEEDFRGYLHAPALYRFFGDEDTESVSFLNGELCGDVLKEVKQKRKIGK